MQVQCIKVAFSAFWLCALIPLLFSSLSPPVPTYLFLCQYLPLGLALFSVHLSSSVSFLYHSICQAQQCTLPLFPCGTSTNKRLHTCQFRGRRRRGAVETRRSQWRREEGGGTSEGKHPCLVYSPDTCEKKVTRSCLDPVRHVALNTRRGSI